MLSVCQSAPVTWQCWVAPASDEAAAPPGSDAWPREPEHLALLACASASGDILLCAGRLFPVAALRLRSLLGTEDVTLRQV
jgi:hypothetical protein